MRKVLVVEDNPENMELLFEILESLGFISHGAKDGNEAIKKVESEHYDLILMDIELPGLDGVAIARIIQNLPAYSGIPIIAVTAYAMKGDREKFLSKGFNDYISKPIDFSEFVTKIKKYADE